MTIGLTEILIRSNSVKTKHHNRIKKVKNQEDEEVAAHNKYLNEKKEDK